MLLAAVLALLLAKTDVTVQQSGNGRSEPAAAAVQERALFSVQGLGIREQAAIKDQLTTPMLALWHCLGSVAGLCHLTANSLMLNVHCTSQMSRRVTVGLIRHLTWPTTGQIAEQTLK